MSLRVKIGLVAGRGNLPFEVLSEMKNRQQEAVVVGLKGEVNPELAKLVNEYHEIPAGYLGEIVETFKKAAVSKVVFAGKVGKEAIFQAGLDQLTQQLLLQLPQKNDDAILLAVVNLFEENGITVVKQTDHLQQHLVQKGEILGSISDAELADIKLGFKMAKAIGGLDIGQSVIVKKGVVLAVEAIEGTDQAIIRGGLLGGPGSIVVKVSKPEQDERFDVPTIGRTTIESMIKVQAIALGIEAGKTLITERDSVIALAKEHQIKIFAGSFKGDGWV